VVSISPGVTPIEYGADVKMAEILTLPVVVTKLIEDPVEGEFVASKFVIMSEEVAFIDIPVGGREGSELNKGVVELELITPKLDTKEMLNTFDPGVVTEAPEMLNKGNAELEFANPRLV
jgi:hypothetical protein